MTPVACVEMVGYIGILLLQGIWYKRGELTENRFALFQVAFWSLFTLTAILAVSTTLELTAIGITLSVMWWMIGYPLARWIYKQATAHK